MRYWDGGGELGIAFLASFVWVTRSEEELNGQKPLLDNSFLKIAKFFVVSSNAPACQPCSEVPFTPDPLLTFLYE
jgi:hypothetical protein